MTHFVLVLHVRDLEQGIFMALIIITTLKETSYLGKPVKLSKQQGKADELYAGMKEAIVD